MNSGITIILDPFTVWLLIFVGMVGLVDFLLGPEGRKKIRLRMEDWWLHLKDVRLPKAGKEEATLCLKCVEYGFGASCLSVRRFVACLVYLMAVFVLAYMASELVRIFDGMPLRPPFMGVHYNTNPSANYLTLFISIAITHYLLKVSIARISGGRFESAKFGLVLVATIVVSIVSLVVVENCVKDGIARFLCIIAPNEKVLFSCEKLPKDFNTWQLLTIFVGEFSNTWDDLMLIVERPSVLFLAFSAQFDRLVNGTASTFYSLAVSYSVIMLRVLIMVLFVVGWAVARRAHDFASLVLYRLTEAEKGPLTALAAGLAALAKILETIGKHL